MKHTILRAVATAAFMAAGTALGVSDTVEAPATIFDYFLAGGKLMWAILACSIVGLAFVIERAIALKRAKVIDDLAYEQITELLQEEGPAAACERARQSDTPMGRVLTNLLTCARSPRAEIGTIVEDAGARELWALQRNAKPLGIISNVAPLLGLLGTVLGIIRAFGDVATQEGAIGNPKILATGIYEALITTAAGLSVAIPAYLFFHFFRSRTEAYIRDIEERSLSIIALLFDKAQARPAEASANAENLDDTKAGQEFAREGA